MLASTSSRRSPASVIELLTTPVTSSSSAPDILNFESDEEALGVLLYVSPAVSGRCVPAWQARISPATAWRQQFGFLLGQVDEVAPYPSTRDGMVGAAQQRHAGRRA